MTSEKTAPSYSFETSSGRHQAPYLHLTPRSLDLVLPPIAGEWSVTFDGRAPKTFCNKEPLRVGIADPFERLEVATEGHAFSFAGVREGIFVVPAPHRMRRQVFVPRGTVVTPEPEERRDSPWAGWAVVTAPAAQPLGLQVPYQPEVQLPAVQPGKDECFTWNLDASTLPNSRTVDGEAVFTASPQIVAHEPLTIELVYVSPEGERELVHEEELSPGPHDLFAPDAYEDPWVGRYEVIVYRDGAEVGGIFVTIAEGLHMRFTNDGPRGTQFRSVDALGELSPFSYNLASSPKKPIVFDKGTRNLGNEPAHAEVVSSEAGYDAAFEVVPAAVTARFTYTGQQPEEFSAKRTILAGLLDEDAHFSVHAPEGLPLAKFVSIDKRAKIKDLVRAGGSTVARRSLSISNQQLKEALGKQSSIELYLLWSTLTYEDYLAGLNDAERVVHLAQDAERRQVEYEATAAADLIYAGLATVRKSPLAVRGSLNAEAQTLDLEWAHEDQDPAKTLAYAWPLDQPTASPARLEPTAEGFVAPGFPAPLVLDLRPLSDGTDLTPPAYPAASALVIEGPGEPTLPDADGAEADYRALRGIGKRSRNPKLEAHLQALAKILPSTQDPQIFIEAGLHLRAGTVTSEKLGEDTRTRPLALNTALGNEPSDDPRVKALRECFRNDIPLHRLYTLRELRATAELLARGLSGLDTSVAHTLIALQAFADAPTDLKAAGSLPYVSYVFALASRALANGKADATVETLLRESAPRLAAVARLAPLLISYDLHTGEGLSQ